MKPESWFGFEVARAKIVVARVVIFGLLALDALLAIRHAPRYGAGGFNVAQLPLLDGLGPTRVSYEVCELLQSALFIFIACGVATRWLLPIATAIYAWLYFGSQLDSYQHHYLVFLVLFIACFAPWQPREPRVRAWAIRLILVQIAIMYLWAAIGKLDAAWLDGRTLGSQIVPKPGDLIDLQHWITATIGFRAMSVLVIATELTLAATLWIPRAAIVAAPLGLLFHLGIVVSGLEIGLFAWLMIGFYTLVVPDRVWTWCLGWLPGNFVWPPTKQVLAIVIALAAGIAIGVQTRYEHAVPVTIAVTLGTVAIAFLTWRAAGKLVPIAVAYLLVFATWLAVDRLSTATLDYYRFWGGSSRRLGDTASAERAYQRLVDVAPNDALAHYQLGRIQLATNPASALVELDEAARLDPSHARALLEEARYLERTNRHTEAVAKALEARRAEPSNSDAVKLYDSLAAGGKLAPTREDEP